MTSSNKTQRDKPSLAEKSLGWAVSGSDLPMREFLNDGSVQVPELEEASEAELQDIMNQLANAQSPGIFLDATFAKLIHEMDELRAEVQILQSQNTQIIDFIKAKGWMDDFMEFAVSGNGESDEAGKEQAVIHKKQSDGTGFGLVVSDIEESE